MKLDAIKTMLAEVYEQEELLTDVERDIMETIDISIARHNRITDTQEKWLCKTHEKICQQ